VVQPRTATAAPVRATVPALDADGAPTALFSCSLSGTVLAVGAALSGLSDRPLAEGLDAPVRALLQPWSHAELQRVLRAAREGATSGSATFRFRHAEGSGVEARTSWSVLAGASADTTQLVFVRAESSAGGAAHRRLRVHEAFGRLSSEVVVVADAQGAVQYASLGVEAQFGYEADDVVASDVWGFLHPDDVPSARAGYQAVVDGGGPRTATLRVRAAAGDWRWVECVAMDLLDQADGRVICAVHDITAEVDAKQALRASEARFRALADASETGVWVLGTTAETLYANTRLTALLGVRPEHAADLDLVSSLDLEATVGVSGRSRSGADRGPEQHEVAYAHPDGHERHLRIAATALHAEDGTPEGTLALVSAIPDVRRPAAEPGDPALRDGLTQLPNRAHLVDRLTNALASAQHSTAVLLVDLDGFSVVNDSHGHDVGDRLLVEVGIRLVAAASGQATVARFGEDEFAVVYEDTDEHRARVVAGDLLDAVAGPLEIDGVAVHVAASIGAAVTPAEQTVSATELLRRADTAVHAAKSAGRGRVCVFDEGLGEDVERRHALAADLRAALAAGALHLEYQPIVDLQSGTVVGMEALARWTHAERGPVPAGIFVPLAELTGLAAQLDRWVIQRAVRDVAALREAGAVPRDAYLAVNLSARNLSDTIAIGDLLSWTEESGLPATQLVLEITETAIMQNTDGDVALLHNLRRHGFRVAMDDFGTGYSSLAYLRDLPISALKIDASFVADITEQPEALAIVASIIDLAGAVGVAVVAEGVESPEQCRLLHRLGCVTAQGWLWSPAIPVALLLSGDGWTSPLDTASDVSPIAATTRPGRREVGVADGLKRLFELHHYGASVGTIAATLNAEGLCTPAGLRWHRTSVARVIAHQIRRLAGAPDAGPGVRRVPRRVETASHPGSQAPSADGEPDGPPRQSDEVDDAGQPPAPST
jgi:diguanylate cyclase (GGDEF)-like protein/PAS domain S-box-containing protein